MLSKKSNLQTAFVFVDSIPEVKQSELELVEEEEKVYLMIGDKLYRFSVDDIK